MISVDPKVDEVLRVLKDDGPDGKPENPKSKPANEPECEDFEESYPDDDLVNTETDASIVKEKFDKPLRLTSWVLAICFKNFGIVFEKDQIMVRFPILYHYEIVNKKFKSLNSLGNKILTITLITKL